MKFDRYVNLLTGQGGHLKAERTLAKVGNTEYRYREELGGVIRRSNDLTVVVPIRKSEFNYVAVTAIYLDGEEYPDGLEMRDVKSKNLYVVDSVKIRHNKAVYTVSKD